MSFIPFLGGKRICLGKTFAELVSKVVGSTLLLEFDYEFIDQNHYKEKPINDLVVVKQPEVFVKVTEAPKVY